MDHKRLTLFAGHYGSGKTNIAVNYEISLAAEGKPVCIADLDIVNPYFRTADSARELEAAGIDLVRPQYANSNVDLPALPPESYRLVRDKKTYGVMDIGGDDRGAYALGRFAPFIREENDYRMAFVVNFCRPLTQNPEDALEVMREIEAACGLRFTCIVNNTNLGAETDPEVLLDSLEPLEGLSRLSGLPIWLHTVRQDLVPALSGDISPVFPLQLQKKFFEQPPSQTADR